MTILLNNFPDCHATTIVFLFSQRIDKTCPKYIQFSFSSSCENKISKIVDISDVLFIKHYNLIYYTEEYKFVCRGIASKMINGCQWNSDAYWQILCWVFKKNTRDILQNNSATVRKVNALFYKRQAVIVFKKSFLVLIVSNISNFCAIEKKRV